MAAAWAVGTAGAFLYVPAGGPEVEVVHWANGHMMNKALLPRFAEQFNQAGHRSSSGKRIVVRPVLVNSAEMTDELVARSLRGSPLSTTLANPTIVTPAADHWMPLVNHVVGRDVIDRSSARVMAKTWIGIVTFREMAEAMGWPRKDVGIADVVRLAADPKGWANVRGARAEWGQQPLLSYTDPSSSSTGRSMLFTLYAIGAGKAPEALTAGDVTRPEVVEYVKTFQRAVDHYVFDTLTLNSKIYQGPRYGHFYFISESNLVQLYQGKLAVTVGADAKPQPLTRPMVFIYPREGSTTHNHSANIVHSPWVTSEQAEAAEQWIAFTQEEAQQKAFMEEGFRPATQLPLADPIGPSFGLDPAQPAVARNTDAVEPDVAEAIVASWEDVKKPGIAVFAVDVSGSMAGEKLDQAKEGLIRALDGMSTRNRVGLLAFSTDIQARVPVGTLSANRFSLRDEIDALRATGYTSLYDAISAGVSMADQAEGDPDSIRGVVVITDGRANQGSTKLSNLVTLASRAETQIPQFGGFESDHEAVDEGGTRIDKKDIVGTGPALKTAHRLHIFFVGIGDADLDIGRILAEATGSSFQGVADKDLAKIIEQFGKYF